MFSSIPWIVFRYQYIWCTIISNSARQYVTIGSVESIAFTYKWVSASSVHTVDEFGKNDAWKLHNAKWHSMFHWIWTNSALAILTRITHGQVVPELYFVDKWRLGIQTHRSRWGKIRWKILALIEIVTNQSISLIFCRLRDDGEFERTNQKWITRN